METKKRTNTILIVLILLVILLVVALTYFKKAKQEIKTEKKEAASVTKKDTDPMKAKELIKLGKENAASGDFNGAKAAFVQAVAADPNSVEAYINLGDLYVVKKDYNTALRYFKEADALKPEDTAIMYKIGLSLSRLGKIDEGNKYYNKVIFSDRKFYIAFVDLAENYEKQKKYASALKLLDNVIDITDNKELNEYSKRLQERLLKKFDAESN